MYAIFCEAVISVRCDAQPLVCSTTNEDGFPATPNVQRAGSDEQETETRRCADSDTASRSSFQSLFGRWWSEAREEPAMHHAEARRDGHVQGDTSFKTVPFFFVAEQQY